MNYKYLAFFGMLIFIALIFGCIGGGTTTTANETKLEVTQGVGVVGTLKIDALNPGLDGYVQLTVRNNLGGETAHNVTVALDNVNPFTIFDCGGYHTANEARNCSGQFDLDKGIPYGSHEASRLAPGEEIDTLWRIRAPSAADISNIALKHPLYYSVTYTYMTDFHENIIFMSQQEQMRRQQAGEDYQITGDSGMGAGELRITGTTQQPIVFFYNYPDDPSAQEAPFSFPAQLSVENQGTGMPISDVIVLFEYPSGITPDSTQLATYGWHVWNDSTDNPSCNTTAQTNVPCKKLISDTFGDALSTINGNTLLYKVVKRGDFVKSFSIYIPLQLTELTTLKQSNTPMKIYTFRLFTMYSYFIEGKDYINVYPIRITG